MQDSLIYVWRKWSLLNHLNHYTNKYNSVKPLSLNCNTSTLPSLCLSWFPPEAWGLWRFSRFKAQFSVWRITYIVKNYKYYEYHYYYCCYNYLTCFISFCYIYFKYSIFLRAYLLFFCKACMYTQLTLMDSKRFE